MEENILIYSGVRCRVDKNGNPELNTEDVSRGLGITRTAASGNEVVRWERVRQYLTEFNIISSENAVPTSGHENNNRLTGSESIPEFIPENIFYKLCFKASNEAARAFQNKVTDEVLPSIRKQGFYLTTDGLTPMTAIVMQMMAVFAQNERKLLETQARVDSHDVALENQDRLIKQQAEKIPGIYKRLDGISYAAKDLADTGEYLEEKYTRIDKKVNQMSDLFTYQGESWRSTIMRLVIEYAPGRAQHVFKKAAEGLKREYGISLDVRIKHRREKMAEQGCSEEEILCVSQLDVLENKKYKRERGLFLDAVKKVISAELNTVL